MFLTYATDGDWNINIHLWSAFRTEYLCWSFYPTGLGLGLGFFEEHLDLDLTVAGHVTSLFYGDSCGRLFWSISSPVVVQQSLSYGTRSFPPEHIARLSATADSLSVSTLLDATLRNFLCLFTSS